MIATFILDKWISRAGDLGDKQKFKLAILLLQWTEQLGSGPLTQKMPWYFSPNPTRFRIGALCCQSILQLVLFHEYAHIVLGHLSDNNLKTPHPWDDQSRGIKYYNQHQNEEYEADGLAAQWFNNQVSEAPEYLRYISYFGLALLFELIALIEAIFASSSPDTHPPAKTRLARIISILRPDPLLEQTILAFQHIFKYPLAILREQH